MKPSHLLPSLIVLYLTPLVSAGWFSMSVKLTPATLSTVTLCVSPFESEDCSISKSTRTVSNSTELSIDVESITTDQIVVVVVEVQNAAGHVSRLSASPSLRSGAEVKTMSIAELTVDLAIGCQKDYYGPSCTRKCAPMVNSLFHIVCDQEGRMICQPGWTGKYCNTRECPACKNGLCDKNGKCLCKQGWTGPNCDECKPTPGCAQGGCRNNTPATCQCLPGWSGPLCDIDESFCRERSPCGASGQCIMRGASDYECICAKDKTGRHCNIDIAVMTGEQICAQNNICYNGGKCEPLSNGLRFSCECPYGYTGRWCQLAVCKPEYCSNGGKCSVEKRDKLTCECAGGWTGQRCQVPPVANPTYNEQKSSSTDFASSQMKLSIAILLVMLAVLITFIVIVLRHLRRVSTTIAAVVQEGRDAEDQRPPLQKGDDLFKVSIDDRAPTVVDFGRYGPAPSMTSFALLQPPAYTEKADDQLHI